MKKRHLFMPLAAVLALASCSSNDDFGLGKGPNSENGDDSYIAVNIVAPRDLGMRADDGGFEVGSDGENDAKTGVFLFYDAAGNPTQTPQTVELSWLPNSATTSSPLVEKISEAMVVIAGNTAPTQVLVILNAPATARLENQTISQVKALVGEYAYSEDGTFMMTNSVYVDGEKEVCATDITNKTYKTEKEAKANPQDIYVERIIAKIRTSATDKDFAKGAEIEINGIKYSLTQELEGIEIANIAKRSYLFKSISGYASWATDFAKWNDAPNKRCYWATSPTALEYCNESWTNITTPTTAQTFYVQENTTTQRTSVLITAILKDNAGEPISFVRWAGKYYFKNNTEVSSGDETKTVEGFLRQYAEIVKNAGYRLRKNNADGTREFVTIDKNYFEWLTMDEHKSAVNGERLEQYEMTAKVVKPEDETWAVVKSNGTVDNEGNINYENSSVEDINNTLFEKVNRVWLWEDGKCYYFKEIEHLNGNEIDPAAIKVGQLGVVRNHIYDLTLNSLKGVGVPVYNPDETIIPQKPSDDLFYIAAQLKILKWKVVKQTVNFE